MDPKDLLFVGLTFAVLLYGVVVVRGGLVVPTPLQLLVGFVTHFSTRSFCTPQPTCC
jgi:hypothetical protein